MEDLVVELVEPNLLVAHSGREPVGRLGWRIIDDDTVALEEEWALDATVSTALIAAAEEFAAEEGFGWAIVDNGRRRLPVVVTVPTPEAMQELGVRLSGLARAGDLLLLSGDLGAGKTTLTQGIGAGLGVGGPVTSPTFVLARIHRARPGRPDLVHVDAYRLGSVDEVADIDLDSDADDSVTVIEWGTGVAEQLSADRLEIDIRRSQGGSGCGPDPRIVLLRPVGDRWAGVNLADELGLSALGPKDIR